MSDVPIYKVGLVLLRHTDTAEPEVLLVRPKPKNPHETSLPWVLPKGSRRYRDDLGKLHDVRDDATAIAQKDRLEPLTDTLLHEAEDEAGVSPALLRALDVREMGVRQKTNPKTSDTRRIHWYVASVEDAQLRRLGLPKDMQKPPEWHTLSDMKRMAVEGKAAIGYVPVVEEAMAGIAGGRFPSVTVPEPKSHARET